MTSVEQFFYGQQVDTFPFRVEFLGICIYRVTNNFVYILWLNIYYGFLAINQMEMLRVFVGQV